MDKQELREKVKSGNLSLKQCKELFPEIYEKDKKTLFNLRDGYLRSVNVDEARVSMYVRYEKKSLKDRFLENLNNPSVMYVRKYKDFLKYDGEEIIIWEYNDIDLLFHDIEKCDGVFDSFLPFVSNMKNSGLLSKMNIIFGDIEFEEFIQRLTDINRNEYKSRLMIPYYLEIKKETYDLYSYNGLERIPINIKDLIFF